jgi:hypothetical protein
MSFDRSAENIDRLFGFYRIALYAMVDREYFQQIGFYDTVQRLLMAREFHLRGKKEEWMKEAMEHKGRWELAAGRTDESDFRNDNSWYYTFWNRRGAEGNADKVAEILSELRSHYK